MQFIYLRYVFLLSLIYYTIKSDQEVLIILKFLLPLLELRLLSTHI